MAAAWCQNLRPWPLDSGFVGDTGVGEEARMGARRAFIQAAMPGPAFGLSHLTFLIYEMRNTADSIREVGVRAE